MKLMKKGPRFLDLIHWLCIFFLSKLRSHPRVNALLLRGVEGRAAHWRSSALESSVHGHYASHTANQPHKGSSLTPT